MGSIALGGPVERQFEVEDLPRVDLVLADLLDQLGQEPPDWGWAAMEVDTGEEQLLSG